MHILREVHTKTTKHEFGTLLFYGTMRSNLLLANEAVD